MTMQKKLLILNRIPLFSSRILRVFLDPAYPRYAEQSIFDALGKNSQYGTSGVRNSA